jgi:UDP-GlcNAc3NAcA epimerase
MSDIFFRELGIRAPDLNLSVGSGSHGAQTGMMLERLERAIAQEQPDWVLVYGDTNSTLAGALAAAKLHVPVAHVEAGLRSFNRHMPEEINRVVVDSISALLLIPTEAARQNLLREGVAADRICWTGDVMYDATVLFGQKAARSVGILNHLDLEDTPFILATVHRAENTDNDRRLQIIVDGLRRVAEQVRVVLPLHPRTRARLARRSSLDLRPIEVIDPVGYFDMLRLEAAAQVIATDSGGVQKEAFFNGVPCVTLREETEWTELVESGWNRLAPPLSSEYVAKVVLSARNAKGQPTAPYGDSHAAERIAEALCANPARASWASSKHT